MPACSPLYCIQSCQGEYVFAGNIISTFKILINACFSRVSAFKLVEYNIVHHLDFKFLSYLKKRGKPEAEKNKAGGWTTLG